MKNIKDFWADVHSANRFRYLTGTDGPGTWHELGVNHLIIPGKNILNIGVGTGRCTRDLKTKKVNIYALDICQEALDKVKDVIIQGWTVENLCNLPSDFFDLALSHLVAQHMSDDMLDEQFEHVIRSLKKDGIFSLQYLTYMTNQSEDKNKNQEGINCRDIGCIKRLAEKNGGAVVCEPSPADFKNIVLDDITLNAGWGYAQIKRKI